MTEKYAARLDDANWRKYFERVEAIPLKERSAPVTAEYEKNRATWESYRRRARQHIRDGIIAHNFAVLSNVLAIAAWLFVSLVADSVILFSSVDWPRLRAVSTGAFWFCGVPFIGLMFRYVMSLISEEREYYRRFGEPEEGAK